MSKTAVDFLAVMNRELRRQLIQRSKNVELRRGAVLFQQDDPGDAFYYLKSGRLEAVVLSGSGSQLTLSVIEEGELVGEIAALDGGPRTATVRALTNCVLIRCPRELAMPVILESPDFAQEVIIALCRRLRNSTRLAKAVIMRRLAPRLADLLLSLAQSDGMVTATHAEMALRLGVTREAVSREIAALRDAKYLKPGGRGRLFILDRGSLRALIEE